MSSNEKFYEYYKTFSIENNPENELEVKFGTKKRHSISEIDFNNVIQMLKSVGFTITNEMGSYLLRIQNTYMNQAGQRRISNLRTQIKGIKSIQKYCNTHKLDTSLYVNTSFMQKKNKVVGDKQLAHIDFDDFNFRVGFKLEESLPPSHKFVTSMINRWSQEKKIFRLLKRFTLIKYFEGNPLIKADLSIVRFVNKPVFTIEEGDLFNKTPSYEIELECMPYTYPSSEKVGDGFKEIRNCIRYVLAGLQQTKYPISNSEQSAVINSYYRLIHSGKELTRRIYPKDFIGPSSISLEVKNIVPLEKDSKVTTPNIRVPYTITEKADGLRKLLYINNSGKIYLINTNMNIQFTGAICKEDEYHNTLIDGEHVTHDKNGNYINKYLAFDIYFIKEEDFRKYPFTYLTGVKYKYKDDKTDKSIFRLSKLTKLVEKIKIESIIKGKPSPIELNVKTFYSSKGSNIFENCKVLLEQINSDIFEYETDGIIFTPIQYGVGLNIAGQTPKSVKQTWLHSFKWKPAKYNTVDFLIRTKKTESGQDFMGNLFQDGSDTITQFKTLSLRVGFDERKHGYVNPCEMLYNNDLPETNTEEDSEQYKPVQFYPYEPQDPNASICNIALTKDAYGNNSMLTEEEQVFEDKTIVEFRYDITRPEKWRWVPLRVRYDKTSEYRRGLKNYGNAYHVAQSVWSSIHNPVTEEMISTGKNIPTLLANEDIYYNKKSHTYTKALRNFHNLFVKKMLIESVSKPGNTLIDLAVGKAGDLSKWISSRLSFVFGIDISKDNIENRVDGACARYLTTKKTHLIIPDALFVRGNSSLNIRDGTAFYTEKAKNIAMSTFGEIPKNDELGRGVLAQYGRGKEGFNVVSCQFALHYFFEKQSSLQNFMRNISDSCKLNGYFIGTCYNGESIFKALEDKKINQSIVGMNDDNELLWEITKKYDKTSFEPNESSLGYAIDVYQESINKTFTEYLVNFKYFIRVMENYGFVLVPMDKIRKMGLPSSNGSFRQLFGLMVKRIKNKKIKKADVKDAYKMTPKERQVSFYNNYFVFQKIRNVDSEKVSLILNSDEVEVVDKVKKTKRRKKTKLKKTL